MKLNSFIASLLITTAITACSPLQKDAQSISEGVRDDIRGTSIRRETPAAVYVTAPPVDLTPIKIDPSPAWLKGGAQVAASGAPFYAVAEEILKDAGIYVRYGPEVNLNMPVVVDYRTGTVRGALEALSAATGYSYEVSDDRVSWSAYVFERFDISYVGSSNNYLIGRDNDDAESNDQAAGGGANTNIQVGSNKSQFSNIRAEDVSVYREIQDTLGTIVGAEGEVLVSLASSSISVRTTPVRMERVRSYMDSVNNALSRQVVLEIKVLKFTSSDSSVSGIDWRAVRTSAGSVLTFDGRTASQLAQGFLDAAPVTIGALQTDGTGAGSSILIQALAQQGAVSVVTEPRIVTQANRVAELEMKQLTGYIARTEVTPNQDSGASTAITPGTVEDGYSIFLMANIDSKNRIFVHVSSLLSDLLGIQRKEVGESAIETPDFVESRFAQTAILRPGETMVLNGLKQLVNQSDTAGPIESRFLKTFAAGKRVVEETVVLVTPTILSVEG